MPYASSVGERLYKHPGRSYCRVDEVGGEGTPRVRRHRGSGGVFKMSSSGAEG